MSAGFFFLPDCVKIRSVNQGEVRVLRTGEVIDEAMYVDVATRQVVDHVLPGHVAESDIPLAVICLDQGPLCCAGAAFTDSLGMMWHYRWDKIHRIIRNCKLTFKDTANGKPLKAQLYTAHIWGSQCEAIRNPCSGGAEKTNP